MLARVLLRSARSARTPALRPVILRATPATRIASPFASIPTRGLAYKKGPRNNQTAPEPTQPSSASSQPPRSSPPTPAASSPSPVTSPPPPETPVPSASAMDAAPITEDPSGATEPPSDASQKPFKLPDLTQGIPSTLEYETAGATNKSALAEIEGDAEGGGRHKGELPASAYVSSTDKRRAEWANRMYVVGAIAFLAGLSYMGRNWDDAEAELADKSQIPNGWTPVLWWKRARARMGDQLSYYHEPAFEKLLPEPDAMIARPYTLCLSLEDLLIHSEWTREHGWRVAKRPGVDYFLRYLSQYYELVLFTSVPFAMGDPLVRKFDPYHLIVWPLYREATKFKDGEIVKDLSYLNRDLSKVIIIDTQAKHVRAQPENAIVLPKWTGDPKDKGLVALVPFLEYIHTMDYPDVRTVIKSFEGTDIPTEFARREALARAEFNKQLKAQKRRHGSGVGALGNLLGMQPSKMSGMILPEGEISPSEAFAQGKMLQDIARERGQRNYEMMEKEIRENGEKWLKEEKAQMEKMNQEAMASMKTGLTGWFLPGQAAPPLTGGEKKA